jgi:hypothetical protein
MSTTTKKKQSSSVEPLPSAGATEENVIAAASGGKPAALGELEQKTAAGSADGTAEAAQGTASAAAARAEETKNSQAPEGPQETPEKKAPDEFVGLRKLLKKRAQVTAELAELEALRPQLAAEAEKMLASGDLRDGEIFDCLSRTRLKLEILPRKCEQLETLIQEINAGIEAEIPGIKSLIQGFAQSEVDGLRAQLLAAAEPYFRGEVARARVIALRSVEELVRTCYIGAVAEEVMSDFFPICERVERGLALLGELRAGRSIRETSFWN